MPLWYLGHCGPTTAIFAGTGRRPSVRSQQGFNSERNTMPRAGPAGGTVGAAEPVGPVSTGAWPVAAGFPKGMVGGSHFVHLLK